MALEMVTQNITNSITVNFIKEIIPHNLAAMYMCQNISVYTNYPAIIGISESIVKTQKDMIEKIQKENWFDFDVIVATPDMMPELGKIGKILGPKGLMPNPKTNTVTPNPAKAVEDINKGMVEFRTDSYGNIHGILGKVSFDEKALQENLEYVVKSISKLKPASVKGKFITSISVSTTMGPGIKVDQNSFDI